MEAELWQRLPEDLLSMVLARLPMRVLGKMRTVCKQWNYLLSSRDALQRIVPNWSLHSTPGFLIQFQWDLKDDVESWVMEGCGSDIYKVALNHIVADTGKSIFCCHRMGDRKDFSIGNSWYRELETFASSSCNARLRFQWNGFRFFHKALHSAARQLYPMA
jgi:hypothetical protein